MGVEEAQRMEQEATLGFRAQMYEALEALAQDQQRSLGKLKAEMSTQMEHQGLRMLDEAVLTLEKHAASHKQGMHATRTELDALTQMIDEGLHREQQARLVAVDRIQKDVTEHLEVSALCTKCRARTWSLLPCTERDSTAPVVHGSRSRDR